MAKQKKCELVTVGTTEEAAAQRVLARAAHENPDATLSYVLNGVRRVEKPVRGEVVK